MSCRKRIDRKWWPRRNLFRDIGTAGSVAGFVSSDSLPKASDYACRTVSRECGEMAIFRKEKKTYLSLISYRNERKKKEIQQAGAWGSRPVSETGKSRINAEGGRYLLPAIPPGQGMADVGA